MAISESTEKHDEGENERHTQRESERERGGLYDRISRGASRK